MANHVGALGSTMDNREPLCTMLANGGPIWLHKMDTRFFALIQMMFLPHIINAMIFHHLMKTTLIIDHMVLSHYVGKNGWCMMNLT